MASAWKDRAGYILQFRRFGAATLKGKAKYLKLRYKAESLDQARAKAEELEQLLRTLEATIYDPQLVEKARAAGALTDAEAEAILAHKPVAPPEPKKARKRLTVMEAARMDLCTRREEGKPDFARHERELREACEAIGIQYADEITLENAGDYLEGLLAEGVPHSTIRHRLLWFKRAGRVGAALGLCPDISKFLRMPHAKRVRRDVYTLAEACRAARACLVVGNPRYACAILLAVGMGLSPSEVVRLRVADVQGTFLQVGEQGAKNENRVRLLPVPATILEELRQLLDRPEGEALIYSEPTARKGDRRHMTTATLLQQVGPIMDKVIGRHVPFGRLRSGFASWSRYHIPTPHLETYMGHAAGLVAGVTSRHYLDFARAEELVPSCEKLDAQIAAAWKKTLSIPEEELRGAWKQAQSERLEYLRKARRNGRIKRLSPTK